MKNPLLKYAMLFIFLFTITTLFATNIAPVAVNDTITLKSGRNYVFNPTLNDYDPDGDPFMLYSVGFKHGSGNVTISYSTINIQMHYSSGTDTIQYIIKDNHNNISNIGYIIVHINNNNTTDTLNINNISAPFTPRGNAFWDYRGPNGQPVATVQYEVPKGSGKSTIFTSVPWIGGLDQSNNLHLAAEIYRLLGEDYFYGPVCDTLTLNQYSDSLWNRVWKISKAEIDYHKAHYWQSNYTIPEAIANWPAKGDTLLGQSENMAPFIDKNNDGKYIPADGDYPKIRGDQSVFIIFNECKEPHTESRGAILGLEFQETAYAYDCPTDSTLNNTIFVHYDIYNRSSQDYHDIYMGLFTDFDIGYALDDYIGCDSSRNLAYGYNSLPVDGYGAVDQYGANPPAQGVVFLSDTMTSFMSYSNTAANGMSLDLTDTSIYHSMQAIWSDGTHLTYGGNGYQGINQTNFLYSGDPNDSTTWAENHPLTGPANYSSDRRAVQSIGPFNLAAGAVKSIDIAYVYARDTSKSNFQNVSVLKNAVDKIKLYYNNDSIPCGGSFSAVTQIDKKENTVNIYPVPTEDNLFIKYLPVSNTSKYEIYNTIGQLIQSGGLNKQNLHKLNVKNYKKGFYFILIYDGKNTFSKKFIIQ